METLSDLFLNLPLWGEKGALVHRTGVRRIVHSYAWLHDRALRLAAWLAVNGVQEGDRVILWGPNSPWWVVAYWGCLARGAVVVPIDFLSGVDRAATIAGLTEARLVLQSRLKNEVLTGFRTFPLEGLEFLLEGVEPLKGPTKAYPDDIAQLVYTSGTTGNPKGVILSHRNLTANLRQVSLHIPVVTPAFVFLSLLPLSHMFEQMGGLLTPLANGATIVYLRTLKPSAIMEALGGEDVRTVVAVPRLLQLLRSSIEGEFAAKGLAVPLRRLLAMGERLPAGARRILFLPVQRRFGRHFTLFVSGGAPLSPDLFRFWSAMGFRVLEGYGLTECAPVLAANTMTCQTAGTVGPPLPGIEVTIAGGEILARGENIFPGYYRNEAATREAFSADGRFRTGDLGEFDNAGNLVVKGRLKELIVTGAGINVYPDEIEEILNRTNGVREGCVVGLDRGSGEEVHAVLIPDGSGRPVEAIVAEVNNSLDELHRISGWTVWPEADFPKTTTLKVRKFQVKERLRQGMRGGEEGAGIDRLTALVARITGVAATEIQEESLLVNELGLTSIGRLELVTALEQEFRLDLEESLITQATRLVDLREAVRRRDKVAGPQHLRLWPNRQPIRLLRRLCDLLFHYPLLRCFVILRARGVGGLADLTEPVLFVANHLSYFDQPCIMAALPPRLRYRTATAAWAEFFFKNFRNVWQRIWKRFTFEYGTIAFNLFPLPQEGGFRPTLTHMGRLVDGGVSILVFPEGERSCDGRLLPFRQGLGIMAEELRVPIVPVRIRGLERVFPRGANWPRRGEVEIIFGEPICYQGEGVGEIVTRIRRAVEEL